MAANLTIDDNLLKAARNIGKHKTRKAVVTEALEDYIQRRQQLQIADLFGSIEYDAGYNYTEQRKKP